MSRKKAGVCACQHEIGYWHDPKTGRCMYGSGVNGAGEPHPPKSIAGGCPCVRKVKTKREKKMNGTTKQISRAVTVDGDRIVKALRTIRGAHLMIAEEIEALIAELARGKVAKEVPAMLAEPSESPAEGVSSRPTNTNGTAAAGARTPGSSGGAASELGAGPHAVLTAIAQWGGSAAVAEIVVATGYATRSVSDYLAELARAGLVTRAAGIATLTDDGREQTGAQTKPTPEALLAYWHTALAAGPDTVLRTLVDAGGRARSSAIVEASGYAARSVSDYLGELARWRLIRRSGGVATLHPDLGGPA